MAVWGAEYPLVTEKADGGVVAAGATGYGSPVYEALGEAAFHERRKIHDLIMEGIDAILKKRQVWGGAVGAVGDLISGVVGKTPWAPAPHARRLTGVTEHPLEDALLWLDVGRPDHLGPLLGFVGNELAKIGG